MKAEKTKKIIQKRGPIRRVVKRRILPEKLPKLKDLTPHTVRETITGIQKAIKENYVFPDQVDDLCQELETHYSNGDYNHVTGPKAFCEQLTQHLRSVVNDRHLQVMLPTDMPDMTVPAKRQPGKGQRKMNPGLIEAKVLPDNIGYINISMFSALSDSLDELDGAMQVVMNTDALIIDLRKCRGGHADSVNYLLSFFFDSKVPFTFLETYFRPGNQTIECQTTETPFTYTKPIYVLTSHFTFSGAEHFAFAMKIHKRATLIGSNTGGGAHPVAIIGLDTGLLFKVPIGRTYDPRTNKDWEGTGVIPDIRCPEEEALTEAEKDLHMKSPS